MPQTVLNADKVRKWLIEHPAEARSIIEKIDFNEPPTSKIRTKRKSALRSDESITKESKKPSLESDTDENVQTLTVDLTQPFFRDLELEATLNAILSTLAELTHSQKAELFILNEETKELHSSSFYKEMCLRKSDIQNSDRRQGLPQTDDTHNISNLSVHSFKYGEGIVGTVAESQKLVNIVDADKDPRNDTRLNTLTKIAIENLLAVPIFTHSKSDNSFRELVAVAIVVNKKTLVDVNKIDPTGYKDEDITKLQKILSTAGTAIRNSLLYQKAKQNEKNALQLAEEQKLRYQEVLTENKRVKVLLEFAISLYKEDDLNDLNKKIIIHARDLLSADRASVFLVDKERNELYSSVFDTKITENIRFAMNKGISGYVATTGQIVNLSDAYEDSRFNKDVDLSTGYRTRSMLSVPIFGPSKDIVAVANLINKMVDQKPAFFSSSDVETFNAFAAFCGLALHKTLLLEETKAQRQMLSVTMELMSYHSTAKPEDIQTFQKNAPESVVEFEKLRDIHFNPHIFDSEADKLARVCVQMFQDLGYVKKYEIEEDKLIRYVLTVRRNYRNVLYHNFGHATAVSHAMYYLAKSNAIKDHLSDIEAFAMFIAALNHDIDHRGTNNNFQKTAQTALASFYSTSTMERHHFNHAMTIISNSNLNILERLNSKDYRSLLKYMEEAILATDLSVFFSNKTKASELVKSKGYDRNNPEHRSLLRGVIMTCCDLSSLTKDFEDSKHTTNNVYNEFFLQGDQEKKLGLTFSAELMDRSKMSEIPRMQVDFYKFIACPAFETLFQFLGESVQPLLNAIQRNAEKWRELKESGIPYEFKSV